MIIKSRLKLKLFLMETMFGLAKLWGFLRRKKGVGNPRKIAILFLKNLGIGDLVMLSPIISQITSIFLGAQVFLVSDIKKFIDFGKVEWMGVDEFKKEKKEFDLIISPTLCHRHFKYIFSAKRWIGYFSKPVLQSNFGVKKYSYDPAQGHYLFRGMDLIKSLNEKIGKEMEFKARAGQINYPALISKEPSNVPECFKRELNVKCLALAPVSKSEDRQWPLERFAEICRYLFQSGKIEKIVFLGDKSEWDRDFIEKLMEELRDLPEGSLINMAGKTTLSEVVYIIKKSEIFIGLDSAPAHFAYQVAKRVLVIFINVNPDWRRPLGKEAGKVICLKPEDESYVIYDGLMAGDKEASQKMAKSITIEKVGKSVDELFEL